MIISMIILSFDIILQTKMAQSFDGVEVYSRRLVSCADTECVEYLRGIEPGVWLHGGYTQPWTPSRSGKLPR